MASDGTKAIVDDALLDAQVDKWLALPADQLKAQLLALGKTAICIKRKKVISLEQAKEEFKLAFDEGRNHEQELNRKETADACCQTDIDATGDTIMTASAPASVPDEPEIEPLMPSPSPVQNGGAEIEPLMPSPSPIGGDNAEDDEVATTNRTAEEIVGDIPPVEDEPPPKKQKVVVDHAITGFVVNKCILGGYWIEPDDYKKNLPQLLYKSGSACAKKFEKAVLDYCAKMSNDARQMCMMARMHNSLLKADFNDSQLEYKGFQRGSEIFKMYEPTASSFNIKEASEIIGIIFDLLPKLRYKGYIELPVVCNVHRVGDFGAAKPAKIKKHHTFPIIFAPKAYLDLLKMPEIIELLEYNKIKYLYRIKKNLKETKEILDEIPAEIKDNVLDLAYTLHYLPEHAIGEFASFAM